MVASDQLRLMSSYSGVHTFLDFDLRVSSESESLSAAFNKAGTSLAICSMLVDQVFAILFFFRPIGI